MKARLFFKQSKPLTVIILGVILLILATITIYEDVTKLEQIITMFCLGLILLGYSVSFEINENYNNKKHFKLFGITTFKSKLELFIPDYVTVFSSTSVKNTEWGPVAAMGSQTKDQSYVVRIFKGHQHFTLWSTKSYNLAKSKAEDLGNLLKIETHLKS